MNVEIYLKKNEERRILAGHLWVYSNEIDSQKTPLSLFKPGELVQVKGNSGRFLGAGYINPHSLLTIRLLTRNHDQAIDETFFKRRLQSALSLRNQCFSKPYYRLIYGESDGLPGLIVDRFNDIYVVQITTAGMEKLKDVFLNALIKLIEPKGILLKNDNSMRELEGLPLTSEVYYGEVPELAPVIEDDCCSFLAPIMQGQKTGWFYDHRMNRSRLMNYVKNKSVLDTFCYAGAWGIQAASYGAKNVTLLDSSKYALEIAEQNAQLNNLLEKITFMQADAFDGLEKLRAENQSFDVIILDPPAFIKRKKDIPAGIAGYRKINELALALLNRGGILFTASCSSHLERNQLLDIVRQSGIKTGSNLRIIEQLHQAQDHPDSSRHNRNRIFKRIYSGKKLAVFLPTIRRISVLCIRWFSIIIFALQYI